MMSACCCQEETLYKPANMAELCACFGEDLYCCMYSNNAMCILPSHPMFKDKVGEEGEGVCCISGTTEALVKPLCLVGEKPLCLGNRDECCCTERYSFPPGDNITPRFGQCFVACCDCWPFKMHIDVLPKVEPLKGFSGASAQDIYHPKIDEEFVIFSCCCEMMTMHIPDTYRDALGEQNVGTCLCCQVDNKAFYFPKDETGYNVIIEDVSDIKCIKPSTLCKCYHRDGFMHYRGALPCDEDVPFSVSLLGCKCCGKEIDRFRSPQFMKQLPKMKEEGGATAAGSPEDAEMTR
jgi:hypothetical protein